MLPTGMIRILSLFLLLFPAIASVQAGTILYSTDGTATPGFTLSEGSGGLPGDGGTRAVAFVPTASGEVSTLVAPLSQGSPTAVFQLFTDAAGAPGTMIDEFDFVVPSTAVGGQGVELLTAPSTMSAGLSAGSTYWLESDPKVFWFGSSPAVFGMAWTTGGAIYPYSQLGAFAITSVPEPASSAMTAGFFSLAGIVLLFRRVKRLPRKLRSI
jgi:hypothetical protein